MFTILPYLLAPFFWTKFLKRKFRAQGVLTPKEEARDLVTIAMLSAFRIFKEPELQKLGEFSKESELEQNRIFNELTVAGVVLLKLILEDTIWRLSPERKPFWYNVGEQIVPTFREWISLMQIDRQYVKLWHKLLKMRLESFRENAQGAQEEMAEHFKESKPQPDAQLNPEVVRITNVAVSTLFYIRKGQAIPNDHLAQYLLYWITRLDRKLRRRIGW